jgi:addiction module RelE/StbE family toxin
MKAKLSPFVQKELVKIAKKDKKLLEKIEKQIVLFEENPKHPSLRVHGELDDLWSIAITMSIRMVYIIIDENHVLFVKLGTHDQVYRK